MARNYFAWRVSPLQHSHDREHVLIFCAAASASRASQCRKSTSVANTINRALNIALEARRSACLYHVMSTTLIEVRRAKPSDARRSRRLTTRPGAAPIRASFPGLNSTSSSTGAARNGGTAPSARAAASRCSRSAIPVAGYANYGRNRARSLYYDGEIYELYLRPEFQGLGFRPQAVLGGAPGPRSRAGCRAWWCGRCRTTSPAVGFYRALGGKAVARSSERFGGKRARQGRLRLERLT